jgi:hypothetical protein
MIDGRTSTFFSGVRFLVEVLGFRKALAVPDSAGDIVHAELRWPTGGAVVFGSTSGCATRAPTWSSRHTTPSSVPASVPTPSPLGIPRATSGHLGPTTARHKGGLASVLR